MMQMQDIATLWNKKNHIVSLKVKLQNNRLEYTAYVIY